MDEHSKIRLTLSPDAKDFIWASGVEDTFVPQFRPGHRSLDEYQLMGHYQHWREDLALARDLGLQALRWGIPWYRVEPFPGEYDWSWTDEVLPYLVEELKIVPIIDLMHYGCPFWLYKEFINREYPQAVAHYAAEFCRRYKSLIQWYTPLNEPMINSLMCGKRALWPPYLRGDLGYVRVMMQLIKGILLTVESIRDNDPKALMVHVEAAGINRALKEDLEALAQEDRRRGFLSYDFITGRVTPDHPLYTWLVRNGAHTDDLADIANRKIDLDFLGLNFYPQWSTKQLYLNQKGKLSYRNIEQDGAGFAALIKDYYEYFRTPVMVTETSAFGSEDVRAEWLRASLHAIKNLRAQGVPVHGYTWFPLFTMIDWRYRFGRGKVEEYYLDLGLYYLNGSSSFRWKESPLVGQMRSYINNPEDSIGPLIIEVNSPLETR